MVRDAITQKLLKRGYKVMWGDYVWGQKHQLVACSIHQDPHTYEDDWMKLLGHANRVCAVFSWRTYNNSVGFHAAKRAQSNGVGVFMLSPVTGLIQCMSPTTYFPGTFSKDAESVKVPYKRRFIPGG